VAYITLDTLFAVFLYNKPTITLIQ